MTFGPAPGASISASKTRIDSDLASVGEQTAIRAGDAGFDVSVRGNTELIGGAITSHQSAVENDLNRLSTGTLSSSDLHNSAHPQAHADIEDVFKHLVNSLKVERLTP